MSSPSPVSRRAEPAHPSRLPLIFFAMATVLIVTIAMTYQMGLMTLRASQTLVSDQDVIDHLSDVLSTVTEAESGQRGFLLTGNRDYLTPYNQAVGRIGGELAVLDRLTGSGLMQRSDMSELHRLTEQKLAELNDTIHLMETSHMRRPWPLST